MIVIIRNYMGKTDKEKEVHRAIIQIYLKNHKKLAGKKGIAVKFKSDDLPKIKRIVKKHARDAIILEEVELPRKRRYRIDEFKFAYRDSYGLSTSE